jgi:hypothetical protein
MEEHILDIYVMQLLNEAAIDVSVVVNSDHFISFITYELDQQTRVFVPDEHFQPTVMERTRFLGPFISYDENKVL